MKLEADIGITIEGTYPYVKGGVSSWCHELIRSLPQFSFSLITLSNNEIQPEAVYPIPDNVVSIHHCNLFRPEETNRTGSASFKIHRELKSWLDDNLSNQKFQELTLTIHRLDDPIREIYNLFRNEACHELIEDSYFRFNQANLSFLDFYWSIRSLVLGYLNVITYPSIKCRIYHSHATGYSGLLASVQKILNPDSKLILTEHGIYTRERTMQLSFSDWPKMDMNAYLPEDGGGFYKKIWNDSFHLMSRICYENCDQILSLYHDNNEVQIEEGAPADKVSSIHNGIDCEHFQFRIRDVDPANPIIGFIGRISRIKNIKSLLTIARRVCQKIPNARFHLAGPTDEEPEYFEECIAYCDALGLKEKVVFLGTMDAKEFYSQVDIIVLTSLSEGQPLVLLEAGACGLPQVCVDVGGIREMVLGDGVIDRLDPSGFVLASWDESGFAEAVVQVCSDRSLYKNMALAARKRVEEHYSYHRFLKSYQEVYERHLHG